MTTATLPFQDQVPALARRPRAQRSIPTPDNPLDQAPPTRWGFLRYPLRFLRARLHLMSGAPLSVRWGLDRGLPAHRYYVRLFLEDFRDDMRGRCLEFQDSVYLDRVGGDAIDHVDVVHIDDSNPRATVVADLTQPNDVPPDTFDCIVCTHVLHLVFDAPGLVEGMHRILKPGGVLLCAAPMTSMTDESENECWRLTRLGMEYLLERSFGKGNVQTCAYGNSIVAAGEMRGMIADEFTWKELHTHDLRSAVEICARAVKQA
jgi:SAM-dependent methyltransferase